MADLGHNDESDEMGFGTFSASVELVIMSSTGERHVLQSCIGSLAPPEVLGEESGRNTVLLNRSQDRLSKQMVRSISESRESFIYTGELLL